MTALKAINRPGRRRFSSPVCTMVALAIVAIRVIPSQLCPVERCICNVNFDHRDTDLIGGSGPNAASISTGRVETVTETDLATTPLEQRQLQKGYSGLCDDYDGILFVSHVIDGAGTGTLFFQSIVDSLLYAEKYNLYPFVWINDADSEPCYDRNVHGVGPNRTFTQITSTVGVTNLVGMGPMACNSKRRTRPGPPDLQHIALANVSHTLIGNGLWQSYFLPISPVPFGEESCRNKPVVEMARSQFLPDMHRCSEFAVRGWAFRKIPDALMPGMYPGDLRDWLWNHRQRAAQIVERYYRLQPNVLALVEQANPIARTQTDGCLAVHVRLTDKGNGRDKKGLESYRPYIDAYARAHPTGGIYVATDDATVLETIRNHWSNNNVSMRLRYLQNAFRSKEKDVPTFALLQHDKHRSNTEALADIYAMARCQYFVHGFSGMAEAVVYLHPALHQRSVNIDDNDRPSPETFEQFVRHTSSPVGPT